MTPTSTQNLNAKLSAPERPKRTDRGIGISWSATAIHSSAPPVRIVGARSRYQGGYRVNC
jgi:hypothetical protein